ncbi:uncharacterized protein BDW43DRAFT_314513 [Aspergillus alliaceus]|uniref:uncharacterized protein n=1 Tax=Petromyces alliaceus TaxID=209559 RepID=UPI0012A4C0DA|nr:uncharacterized protein BDW43DRAFT_314513 [Aspergillus alliaceus]KAB8229864.1 hypothetical protein BDW43DRAFT_314513 [Aspergillus alliaceus]
MQDTQLVSNMMYFYSNSARSSNGRQSWILLLPDLITQSRQQTRVAVLATSMLLLAIQSREERIFVESLGYYCQALISLRRQLPLVTDPQNPDFLPLTCVAIVLSFFEALCGTLFNGYYQHVQGAVVLLQIQGPRNCALVPYHSLFYAVRNHAICASLMTGKISPLAGEPWLTIPFSLSKKSSSDLVNDILLAMPRYLSALNADETASETSRLSREDIVQDLMNHLQNLAGIWSQISQHEHPIAESTQPTIPQSVELTQRYTYDNPYHAKVIANYRTAHLLAFSLLSIILPCHDWDVAPFLDDSASILSAAGYLEECDIGCAYFQMVFPLRLVAQHSPCATRRRVAIDMLKRWCGEKPVRGLANSALEAIYRGQCVIPQMLIL